MIGLYFSRVFLNFIFTACKFFKPGFSADSGLPVYADIARVEKYASRDKTYADLADISLLVTDPELFTEFWMSCVVSTALYVVINSYFLFLNVVIVEILLNVKISCTLLMRNRGPTMRKCLIPATIFWTSGVRTSFENQAQTHQ